MRRRNARLLGLIAALPLSAGLVAPVAPLSATRAPSRRGLHINELTPSRRLALGPARHRARLHAAPNEEPQEDDSNLIAALSIAAAGAFGAGIYATMGAEKALEFSAGYVV